MVKGIQKWGVTERNENGDNLVDICTKNELFLLNTYFQHKMILIYRERRQVEQDEQKGANYL